MKTPTRTTPNPLRVAAAGLLFALAACDGSGSSGPDDAGADADTDADADADADTDADADADTDTGTGEACVPADEAPWLEPADIQLMEVSEPLTGSFLYYSVWGSPDSLEMITPDGLTAATRFTVHRLWSFGVAHDGVTVAFSSLDPQQEEHFCITVGDAIQHSWLLPPDGPAEQITTGRVNDECHLFSPDDQTIYLCRRAGFWQEMTDDGFQFGSDPYRILSHDRQSGDESWLTDLQDGVSDIGPALRSDGSFLFWRQEPDGTSFAQFLMSMDADGGNVEYLVESGTGPATSPDGGSVIYRASWSEILLGDAFDPATAELLIPAGDATVSDLVFSPDMTRIAFTRGRPDASCSDLWVADIETAEETLLVDCVAADQFIAGIAWVEANE